jgi:hypothetical protein
MINVKMPQLYRKQYDAFFNDSKISVTEGSTKSGKTVSGIVWQATKILEDTLGLEHWWVAPVYSQAKMAYDQSKIMFREVYNKSNDTDLTIFFPNGSKWVFRSGEKPDNLYGSGVGSLVIDEFTRLREEAYYAAMSTTTATEAQIRLIGNVRGRGWGWKLARKAASGAKGYSYHKITVLDAMAAGVVSQESYEKSKRDYPEDVFNELFLCIPRADGGNPFGLQHIDKCTKPVSTKPAVCYGVDLAKSVDWTVVIGLDEDGHCCFFDRWQSGWNETKPRILNIVGNTPTLIDSTGVGNPIVEELRLTTVSIEGYHFSQTSKMKLIQGLVAGIQSGIISYPQGIIVSELEIFEYVETMNGVKYEAPSGSHDDTVIALALAWRCYNTKRTATWSFANSEDSKSLMELLNAKGKINKIATMEEVASYFGED